jgi:hypothetical protein
LLNVEQHANFPVSFNYTQKLTFITKKFPIDFDVINDGKLKTKKKRRIFFVNGTKG